MEDIIPISMDNQNRVYRGNIGKNIDPKDFSNYKDLTKYVRDMMGLLRLCIIQSYGVYKRSELNEIEEDFVNEIMNETENGYTVEVIEKSRYKSEVPSTDEVFEPIRKIKRK